MNTCIFATVTVDTCIFATVTVDTCIFATFTMDTCIFATVTHTVECRCLYFYGLKINEKLVDKKSSTKYYPKFS